LCSNLLRAKGGSVSLRKTSGPSNSQTSCQVIVNNLNRSLWYYLRMIDDTDLFLKYYTEQIQTDKDMKAER